jgi:putative peptidoglycan lipid II flippase
MSLWSAQAIYSRAFYAAGNTFVPMAAGTIVTLVSLPIYMGLFHAFGAMGLAIASNIGIALQTMAVAGLLHQRHMVSLAGLDYPELGRCLAAGIASWFAIWIVLSFLTKMGVHIRGRWYDLTVLIVGGVVWAGISMWVLKKTGSALPRVIMKRLRPA